MPGRRGAARKASCQAVSWVWRFSKVLAKSCSLRSGVLALVCGGRTRVLYKSTTKGKGRVAALYPRRAGRHATLLSRLLLRYKRATEAKPTPTLARQRAVGDSIAATNNCSRPAHQHGHADGIHNDSDQPRRRGHRRSEEVGVSALRCGIDSDNKTAIGPQISGDGDDARSTTKGPQTF